MIENKIAGTGFSVTNKSNKKMEVFFSSADKTYLIYMNNSNEFLGVFNKEDTFSDTEHYLNNILNLIQSIQISEDHNVIIIVENKNNIYDEIFMFKSEIIYRDSFKEFREAKELLIQFGRAIEYKFSCNVKKKEVVKKSVKSIESEIAFVGNNWLKEYKLDLKMGTASINQEISDALQFYSSKGGGQGGNIPDSKLLLKSFDSYIPVVIEYKGLKDKLVKLDNDGIVENINKNTNEPHFNNIKNYAVNGAIHYANAILLHSNYTEVISIGMTGYKDTSDNLHYEIGVYYVSKSNLGVGQKVGEYTDFSFLKEENGIFDDFIKKSRQLNLSLEELEKIKEEKENEIDNNLKKLHNDIYTNEKGLSGEEKYNLIMASIFSFKGSSDKKVEPLDYKELKGKEEKGYRDGDIIFTKITSFIKNQFPNEEVANSILSDYAKILKSDKINKSINQETQLQRIYKKTIEYLGFYYKIELTTDFSGKLFNEIYKWMNFSEDKENDVVLTPPQTSVLLSKLARLDENSVVLDLATGSGGLIVSAVNEMINQANLNINNMEELKLKIEDIKSSQFLGFEILSSMHRLATENMMCMSNNPNNIFHKNSLTNLSEELKNKNKPNRFLLNPPYSIEGNGMILVEKGLNMLEKGGYGSIIIQSSAGSGKAKEINKRILKNHTLLASIKMPVNLFIGKASVQTNIYVFKVWEKHEKNNIVRFIDFSNDGYIRTNRKKMMNNIKDSGIAKAKYNGVVELVKNGIDPLNLFSETEYFEGTIDPTNGEDWNRTIQVETKPILKDFEKTISDFLSWEISTILKKSTNQGK